MPKLVACGEFVKRQTKESGYSHFDGSWEELEELAIWGLQFNNNPHIIHSKYKNHLGYKNGVLLVEVDPSRFYSAIVDLTEDSKLKANYAPRRIGEDAFIRISSKAKKQRAKFVQVVLYSHDVLMENNEAETDAEWEIVAIKARVSEEEEPMDPYTMARNFLHLKGGTKGDFSAEQFAKSIVYWNQHTMTTGSPKWFRKIIKWWRE